MLNVLGNAAPVKSSSKRGELGETAYVVLTGGAEFVAVGEQITRALYSLVFWFSFLISACEITDRAGHPAIICLDDRQGGPNDPRLRSLKTNVREPRWICSLFGVVDRLGSTALTGAPAR